jgi:glutathione S-transferase
MMMASLLRMSILLLLLSATLPALSLAMKIRLFNSGTCPYAQRAWIALEECAIPYEHVIIDLQDKPQHFIELYQKANPISAARSKVPLLQVIVNDDDDEKDFLLCESLVVAEYIAEVHGKDSLWAPSPEDRARVRLFTELCGSTFSYFPLLRLKATTKSTAASAADDDDGMLLDSAALESFKEGLNAADAFLRGLTKEEEGVFLLGDHFSLAECNAAPFIQRCCAILPEFTGIDPLQLCDELGLCRLKSWIEAVLARPSVVKTGVSMETMRESTKGMLERLAAMDKAGENALAKT